MSSPSSDEPHDREPWPRPAYLDPMTLARAAVDRVGRKDGHWLDMTDYLLAMGRINPERVRRVPAIAVTENGVDDDGEYALLLCPCNARPIVRGTIAQCVGCERWYTLNRSGRVWVVYGAMTPPPLRPDTTPPVNIVD